MSVVRKDKKKNFTVMGNDHLQDKRLSVKAKGLLSTMLMLPDSWDYSVRGLATLSSDGIASIRSALQELEKYGYLVRRQIRDDKGLYAKTEYTIYEKPQQADPMPEKPITDPPAAEEPVSENRTQKNTKGKIPEVTSTKEPNTNAPYNPISSYQSKETDADAMLREMGQYRALILQNISYDLLIQDHPYETACIDELVELLVETVCSQSPTIRVGRQDMPQAVVQSRLLKITKEHVEYVLECLQRHKKPVGSIRSFLLTTLYNAPATMDSYYTILVNSQLAQ